MTNAYEDLMSGINRNWYKDNKGYIYKINGICEQTDKDVWKLQVFRRLSSGKLVFRNESLRFLGELQRLEGSELEQLAQSEKPLILPKLAAITNSRPVNPFTDPNFYDDCEPGK